MWILWVLWTCVFGVDYCWFSLIAFGGGLCMIVWFGFTAVGFGLGLMWGLGFLVLAFCCLLLVRRFGFLCEWFACCLFLV